MLKPTAKILIVDDSISIRKIITHILKQMGFSQTVESKDAEQAYELLHVHLKKPDPIQFIICDLNLPKMSGIDFIKKCRAEKAFEAIPFLLVTADTDLDKIKNANKEGFTDYILKPFSPAVFKSKFEKYLN